MPQSGKTTKAQLPKRPVGRPRIDGLPAGSVPKKPKMSASARKVTTIEVPGQPPKRGRGRPPKHPKPPGSAKPSTTPASSMPSPPLDPGPRRGPIAGTFTVPATESLYNPQLLESPPDSDSVGSDSTDISERIVQGTREFADDSRGRRERATSDDEVEEREESIVRDSSPMFRHDVRISGIERDWRTSRLVEDEVENAAEQEGETEESKRQAELRRREVERQRQKRECEAYYCYTEGCRINHVARANSVLAVELVDEVTQRFRPMVDEADEEAAARAGVVAPIGQEATEGGAWSMSFDYPGSSGGQFQSSFADIEARDWLDWI